MRVQNKKTTIGPQRTQRGRKAIPSYFGSMLTLPALPMNIYVFENNPEKIMEHLGDLFCGICRAKPFTRGEPSIGEMLIRGIWFTKTKSLLPPWKIGVVPWIEAVKELDRTTFSRKFKYLFEEG